MPMMSTDEIAKVLDAGGLKSFADVIRNLANRVSKLENGLRAFLADDYPNPETCHPNPCPHGAMRWQGCDRCDSDFVESLLKDGDEH